MLDTIQNRVVEAMQAAYQLFERLGLTLNGLVVASVVLVLGEHGSRDQALGRGSSGSARELRASPGVPG